MVKRVLMIAYHYPPLAGGSGQLRTLAFAERLQQFGWQPVVLTVHQRAHEFVSSAAPVPTVPVHRAFAIDSSRHLAVRGRYPAWLAQPDRWISWWLGAFPAGLRLIQQYHPDLIWSTYPIATAHLIALSLQRVSGLPWVADQRDPMLDIDYPADPLRRRLHGWIERLVLTRSRNIVCTSPGAIRRLRQRYPDMAAERTLLIPNGYDEASFIGMAEHKPQRQTGQRFVLLHSGVIYPSERDPRALFAALAQLCAAGRLSAENFCLRLRGSEHEDYLATLIATYPGLAALVELLPLLPHAAALEEMFTVDALLLLQAANCNDQIPAKVYEYLRVGQPLLALTDAAGDTCQLLQAAGIDTVAALDDSGAIAAQLLRLIDLASQGRAPLASAQCIATNSRSNGCRQLAELFTRIAQGEQP